MFMACREFNDLVESYLADELPEIKKEAFEAHYFQCDACFAELKLRERLYSREVPIILTGKKHSRLWGLEPLFKPVLALAAVLVIVISTLWIIEIGNYREGKYLENISQVELPIYIQTETRDSAQGLSNRTFARAMIFYNNQQYGDALKLLNSLDSNTMGVEPNPQVLFFKAVCSLETGDLRTAVKHFDMLIEKRNPSYYDDVIFYKGIALLRLHQKKQALEQFQILAILPSPYLFQARAIIDKINKL